MKSIIIDDNEIALLATQQCVLKAEQIKLLKTFNNALQALSYIASNQVYLIFLDIEMPELNGIEFIKAMKHPHPLIVLTTSHPEFALEAYEHNVLDYLVKPIALPRFLNAVAKAQAMFEKHNIDKIEFLSLIFDKISYEINLSKESLTKQIISNGLFVI
jgi:two-component SAPR family response regulator